MPIIGTFTGSTSFGRSGGGGKMLTFGGTSYTKGDYTIAAFTYNNGTSETFSIANAPAGSFAEVVVIGGGGGGNGGYGSGGGGGAGGLTYMPPIPVQSGNVWTITVGAGGAAGAQSGDDTSSNADTHGRRGGNSTVITTSNGTITGGGGGGGNESFYYSSNFKDGSGFGASGGGGGDWWPSQRGGGTATRAAAFAGGYRLGNLSTGGAFHYGYNGGSRDFENGSHEAPHEGSGGGGAAGMPVMYGAPYGSGTASSGGRGLYLRQYDITGLGSPSGWFAGGGGGGYYTTGGGSGTQTNGTNIGGYFGGGGRGRTPSANSTAGVNGTGSGGGGGGNNVSAGNGPGGHGIVLIRYKTSGGSFSASSTASGSSESNPARSASHILAVNPSATSGYYWIESYGVAKQVYCDMTSNGGGWMLMSYTGTDQTQALHVLDNEYNYPSSLSNISTDAGSGAAFNVGQLFIDGLVRRGRSNGIALFRIDGNMRYFFVSSTAEWAPCHHRAAHNYHGQHDYAGNQWLKSCYTGYTSNSSNGGAGELSGTNITWGGSNWGTFPYNMSTNDGNNFGYSIDPQYSNYFHGGNANTNWVSCHSNGWNKAGSFWLKIGPNT